LQHGLANLPEVLLTGFAPGGFTSPVKGGDQDSYYDDGRGHFDQEFLKCFATPAGETSPGYEMV
jgi:hypothetical protein